MEDTQHFYTVQWHNRVIPRATRFLLKADKQRVSRSLKKKHNPDIFRIFLSRKRPEKYKIHTPNFVFKNPDIFSGVFSGVLDIFLTIFTTYKIIRIYFLDKNIKKKKILGWFFFKHFSIEKMDKISNFWLLQAEAIFFFGEIFFRDMRMKIWCMTWDQC